MIPFVEQEFGVMFGTDTAGLNKMNIVKAYERDGWQEGGYITAVAKLSGVCTVDDYETKLSLNQYGWFVGEHGHILTDVVTLKQPIPYTGHQGFRELSGRILQTIRDEYKRSKR